MTVEISKRGMTVEELQAVLSELPKDCVVKIIDYDGEWSDINKIKLTKTYFANGSEEVVEIHY